MRPAAAPPLVLVLSLCAAAPAPFQPSECLDAYRDSFFAHWGIAPDDWAALCAQTGTADAALRMGRRAFPAPGVQSQAEARPQALRRADASVNAASERVGAALADDVATLYGERAASASPGPDSAAPAESPPAMSVPRARSKRSPPPGLPTDRSKTSYIISLERRLMDNGSAPEAIAYLRARYRDLLEHLDVDTLGNLVVNGQHLALIPKDKKLTDVAPFTHLREMKTFDGRSWSDVRAVANVPMGQDKPGYAAAVPEENMVGADGYGKGFTFFHEYGHAVHSYGLAYTPPPPNGWTERIERLLRGDPPTGKRVKRIYDAAMRRPQKTGLDAYANSNDLEMYAQATAAFFGAGYTYYKTSANAVPFKETPLSLYRADSDLFRLCMSVYGRPGRHQEKK
ncbi:MAG: hypothetical protein HY403_06885 [Elusimicrobia bacterium]|nr:hypothetical protein [Elusimicrobiota bacterium]